MDTILVVNAGSSSVKFQVFAIAGGEPKCVIKGQIEGVGTWPRLKAQDCDGALLVDTSFSNESIADVPAALHAAGLWLREEQRIKPIAVGHRVVHGGPDYDGPVLVDDAVIKRLEKFIPLAPLHQPNNLAPIRSIRARFPELPQVACFDTAFHRGHAPVADHYAIPAALRGGSSAIWIPRPVVRIHRKRVAERRPSDRGGPSNYCASRQRSIDVRARCRRKRG